MQIVSHIFHLHTDKEAKVGSNQSWLNLWGPLRLSMQQGRLPCLNTLRQPTPTFFYTRTFCLAVSDSAGLIIMWIRMCLRKPSRATLTKTEQKPRDKIPGQRFAIQNIGFIASPHRNGEGLQTFCLGASCKISHHFFPQTVYCGVLS